MKTTVIYVALLLLALAAEGALLRAGAGLRAPLSVGGAWQVRLADADARIASLPPAKGPLTLTIDQSGRDLDVHLGTLALRGTLDGAAVEAFGAGSSAATLSAVVDGRSMRGRFEPGGVAFVATREDKP